MNLSDFVDLYYKILYSVIDFELFRLKFCGNLFPRLLDKCLTKYLSFPLGLQSLSTSCHFVSYPLFYLNSVLTHPRSTLYLGARKILPVYISTKSFL